MMVTDLMMHFPDAVSDARGTFHARAMARLCGDSSWEGWLEFIPTNGGASTVIATPIETRQHDRVTMHRWASGLTRVYAEGALSRAGIRETGRSDFELLSTLQELI